MAFVALACLAGIGIGLSAGGILGAITGLVVAMGTGSGVAIMLGAKGTGVSSAQPVRFGQRIGGLVAAVGCLGAASVGGWQWGWATGLLGYLLGVAVAGALGLGASYQMGRQLVASQSEGLAEPSNERVPVVPMDEFMVRTAGGRPNQMDTTPYDGHPFSCACGETHDFDTATIKVIRELMGMRLVLVCPTEDAVTCVKVKGMLRFGGFESQFGARA